MSTLKNEIEKTVKWFAEMDVAMNGEVSESTKEVAKVQKVELKALFSTKPGISYSSAVNLIDSYVRRGMSKNQCKAYAEYVFGISDLIQPEVYAIFKDRHNIHF